MTDGAFLFEKLVAAGRETLRSNRGAQDEKKN
jgi:hypothetical protein